MDEQNLHVSSTWCFTVIKAQGLHLLHSQKSWRAIVTVELDKEKHETVLGVDGQNPNLKEAFYLQGAAVDSKVQISVWNRSESKKKSKKRNLLARASHTLGDLFDRQDGPKSHLKIPLTYQATNKRTLSGRGKKQSEVALYLRLKPPPGVRYGKECGENEMSDRLDEIEGYATSIASERDPYESLWNDDDTLLDLLPGNQIRKRNKGGYIVDSDISLIYAPEDESADENMPIFKDGWDGEMDIIESDSFGPVWGGEEGLVVLGAQQSAGILLQHKGPADLSFIERALASFTVYRELKLAELDPHYKEVFERLRAEWTYVGGVLIAFSGVNTTVFAISPDAVFTVDSYARRAIAASSITSGLGIACLAWILLRYNWVDLETFKTRARDVLGSYFFFSLTARIPLICLFLSTTFLIAFLSLVAFDAWPAGVVVISFLVGLFMTLQFLVYGAKWIMNSMVMCISGIQQIFARQENEGG